MQKKSKKDPKFVRREMKKLQYAKVGKYYYLEKMHVPGADPLWPGVEAEYSTMVVPSLGKGAYFWVASERGDIYNKGVGPTSSIRLTSVPFPFPV